MRNEYSSGEKEHASFKFSVRENPRVPGRIFILVGIERQLIIRRLNNISPRHSESPRLSLEVIKIIIKIKKTRIDRRRPKCAGEDKIEEEDGEDGHFIYRDKNLNGFFQCPRER